MWRIYAALGIGGDRRPAESRLTLHFRSLELTKLTAVCGERTNRVGCGGARGNVLHSRGTARTSSRSMS
jgi:hypothetical protein